MLTGTSRRTHGIGQVLAAFAAGKVFAVIVAVGVMMIWVGSLALARRDPALNSAVFFTGGGLIAGLGIWGWAYFSIVLPWRRIVWFRYDRKRLEFRRARDAEIRECTSLDILRIEATSSRRGGIAWFTLRLADGTRLVIDPALLENASALAERIAADIASSPRTLFS